MGKVPSAQPAWPKSAVENRIVIPYRIEQSHLDRLTQGETARAINLSEQYKLSREGDVARRLQLQTVNLTHVSNITNSKNGMNIHGMATVVPPNHPPHFAVSGIVSPRYTQNCFQLRYFGPSYFTGLCWYPQWAPWVGWSWQYRCHPFYDPRPALCRPVAYAAATPVVHFQYPAWVSLPVVKCGTWVNVPRVLTPIEQYDLQLLAVRFVDPGHPQERLGPRYRVWFRNNSSRAVAQPFNVTLFAANNGVVGPSVPQAGIRVTSIEGGATQSVDIRLPFLVAPSDAPNQPPYRTLNAVVDSSREIRDVNPANNGATLAIADILPVDPAVFQVDPVSVPAGGDLTVAGEGLGPQPGKAMIHAGDAPRESEVLGWYDLGVHLHVPGIPIAAPTNAELIVIRGDGAAANPIQVTLNPP